MPERQSRTSAPNSPDLRVQAEALIRGHVSDLQAPSPEEVQRLVYELEVHRVELEMQNEALRQAQQELEASRDRYVDLYDFAPLGYVTVDHEGYVQEINLAGAKMVNAHRSTVTGYPFVAYVAKQDKITFRQHVRQCTGQRRAVTSELTLVAKGGRTLGVQLHSIPIEDPTSGDILCRTAISDITALQQAQAALQRAHEKLERRVEERTVQLADANRQLQAEIEERNRAEETLREEQELLGQLLELHERDRQLVAYEIHDGVMQLLTSATMRFDAFQRGRKQYPSARWDRFDAALKLLRDSLSEGRRLIGGLQPAALEVGGIVAAIDALVAERQAAGGPEITFVHHVRLQRLATPLEYNLFRIAQEALSNADRHGSSDKVRIELAQQEGQVRLEVADDGVGFDPDQVAPDRFGLKGIRERARLLGGQAAIESAPDKGTRVTVELPILHQPPGRGDTESASHPASTDLAGDAPRGGPGAAPNPAGPPGSD